MTFRAIVIVAAVGGLAGLAPAADLKFAGDSSKIEFVGTKKDGSHNGGFKTFAGDVVLPGDDFAQAKVTVKIQTGSLFADNPKLTGHLKSPDFFDVGTYPTATFTSTAIRPADGAGGATHVITGNLTLHGVTKPVTIPVKVTRTGGLGLDGKFVLKRMEFGMKFGQGQVNDDVTVTLSVRAK
jgi:polyisoprenoid-binding protein YceI